MGMVEQIDKWEVVSKLITLQNNYNFFKNEWDAERLCREIAKLEIGIGKTPGLQLVRCKDCKHYDACELTCELLFNPCATNVAWYPEDFCSYGERKDNE